MPTISDKEGHYRVQEQSGAFRVMDSADATVLACKDRVSAHHYVDLLNKAYRAGYKAGYRDGKV